MAVEIVTGKKGTAHVSSNDDQGRNQSIVGPDSYVAEIGEQLGYNLVSNNELSLRDGEAYIQGVHFRILPGSTESVTIENGTQSTYRKDLVVARYAKNASNGFEDVTLHVIKGVEANTENAAVLPSYTAGDILNGAILAEMPLYEVDIAGITVSAVKKLFATIPPLAQMKEDISQINADLSDISNTLGTTAIPFYTTTDVNGNIRVADVPEINNIPRRRFILFNCISTNAITIIPYIDQNLNELFLHPKGIFGWNDLPNANIYIECIVSKA